MSYYSPGYFRLFEDILGTTPAIAYRGLSERDQRLKVIDTSNTHKLLNTIQKGYKEHNALLQQNHHEMVVLERENMRAQEEANELTENQNFLLGEQNQLLEEQNNHLVSQNRILEQQNQQLGSMDLRLLSIDEQNKIHNQKLEQLIEISKIPDFEKERLFFFEESHKYLIKANENPKRYSDALFYLEKAYTIYERDFLVNYDIGTICLYDNTNLNFEKALHHFSLAADYGLDSENQKLVFTSFLNIAYIHYLNLNFVDSLQMAGKAIELVLNIGVEREISLNSLLLYLENAIILGDKEAIKKGLRIYREHNYLFYWGNNDYEFYEELLSLEIFKNSDIIEDEYKDYILKHIKNLVEAIQSMANNQFEIQQIFIEKNVIKLRRNGFILAINNRLSIKAVSYTHLTLPTIGSV